MSNIKYPEKSLRNKQAPNPNNKKKDSFSAHFDLIFFGTYLELLCCDLKLCDLDLFISLHFLHEFAIILTMTLYLIRHAEALGRGENQTSDYSRTLSHLGRAVAHEVGLWLSEQKQMFDVLVSSPAVRAVQTTEIIASAFKNELTVEVQEGLGTDGSSGQIVSFLSSYQHLKAVAIVGHEPTLGILAAIMLNIERKISFSPAAVCCLSGDVKNDKPSMNFQWMLSPSHKGDIRNLILRKIDALELLV